MKAACVARRALPKVDHSENVYSERACNADQVLRWVVFMRDKGEPKPESLWVSLLPFGLMFLGVCILLLLQSLTS